MSIITIQLGQCGNQLGTEFFTTIASEIGHLSSVEAQENAINTFFRPSANWREGAPPVARALLIDMEPKVVNRCQILAKQSGNWSYDYKRQLCRDGGSGNNWGHGYNMHGPEILDDLSELIRQVAFIRRCCRRVELFLYAYTMMNC